MEWIQTCTSYKPLAGKQKHSISSIYWNLTTSQRHVQEIEWRTRQLSFLMLWRQTDFLWIREWAHSSYMNILSTICKEEQDYHIILIKLTISAHYQILFTHTLYILNIIYDTYICYIYYIYIHICMYVCIPIYNIVIVPI